MKIGIYILRCNNGRYYIGSTNDLERRIEEHTSGRVRSTAYALPIKLALFQECDTVLHARRTEFKIKQLKSRRLIEKWIIDGKIENRYMQP